ncbi:uncharacterized protein LOC126904092 isoform X2 [Daktulosphaira vitifoliae]|uniref:uncharacterized protein LOC126904092 isoform X2 n=1 Tax=Daktulosphaira vitifoliae TaxID=58002 RepID=UPI0021AA9F6E|nr:uncharacterized protein LOC126904092 isoform X2 [Daktulosphaira vitifoliae]
MIKFILYFTSVLLSLIGDPNEDSINKNSEDMSKENTKKIPDDLLCHFCESEENSVTFYPCGHITGNYCANKFLRRDGNCPFCLQKIIYYKDIVNLEDHDFESQSPYRFRSLTEKELNNLKSKIKKGMTDEEFMARFWYLRRCQEPDYYMLLRIECRIITKADRRNIAKLKKAILSGDIPEITVYKKYFRALLNDTETTMLNGYYNKFQTGYTKYELKIRKNYLNFTYT